MRKKRIALCLTLLLLLGTACDTRDEPAAGGASPSPAVSRPTSGPSVSPPGATVSPPPPEETDPPLAWTREPVLSKSEMPGDYNGLELPIQGATGYTSVELPLWETVADSEAARAAVEEWQARQAQAQAEAEARAQAEAQEQAASQQAQAENQGETDPPAPTEDQGETDPPAQAEGQGETEPLVRAEVQTPATAAKAAPGDGEDIPPPPPSEEEPDPSSAEESVPPGPDEGQPESAASEMPEPAASETPEPSPSSEATGEDAPSPEPSPSAEVQEPEEPEPSLTDGALALLPPGTAFTVLREEGGWWQVRCGAAQGWLTGWLEHRTCLVNLPDVIPSMVYDATNSYASRFVSCGKALDGVTGQALYPSKTRNDRLGQREFMMPVLYSMAFHLCAAQRSALAEGNSLILYEGYRPYEVQMKVCGALSRLVRIDQEVRQAVTGAPWSISWFIATSYSNHQRGYAVDVSLVRVRAVEERATGGYRYIRVTDYGEYEMPTAIHELSSAAATFTAPVASHSATAWKSAQLSENMNEPALGLQGYCTGAGLTPLASEWWHFNDLAARTSVLDRLGSGGFTIDQCLSAAP